MPNATMNYMTLYIANRPCEVSAVAEPIAMTLCSTRAWWAIYKRKGFPVLLQESSITNPSHCILGQDSHYFNVRTYIRNIHKLYGVLPSRAETPLSSCLGCDAKCYLALSSIIMWFHWQNSFPSCLNNTLGLAVIMFGPWCESHLGLSQYGHVSLWEYPEAQLWLWYGPWCEMLSAS